MTDEVVLPAAESWGPKLRALRDDRQRRFAWAMACGELKPTDAARRAGYSDPGKHSATIRVRSHELMHDQRVVDAIEECGTLLLRHLAPVAIKAARRILEQPKHRAHARMIEVVLDRTGFAAKTEHEVSVKHSVDFREVEALARRLAVESGVPVARLLGPNVIEGEVVDEPERVSVRAGGGAADADGVAEKDGDRLGRIQRGPLDPASIG